MITRLEQKRLPIPHAALHNCTESAASNLGALQELRTNERCILKFLINKKSEFFKKKEKQEIYAKL